MKNWTVPLPLAAAVLITGVVVSIATKPANVLAQGRSSYAEDRAAIEACKRVICSRWTSTIRISTSPRSPRMAC